MLVRYPYNIQEELKKADTILFGIRKMVKKNPGIKYEKNNPKQKLLRKKGI